MSADFLKTLRLLVVEDREDDARLLLLELERGGYDVAHHRVDTMPDLRCALARDGWDLVISDFSLPTLNAFDVLTTLRTMRPELPCIVMSGTIDEEAAVEVLRTGARDFVVKDRMTRLLPAIRRELEETIDRGRVAAAEEALRATRDRMQMVVETVGIGTFDLDMVGGVMAASEIHDRLHGIPSGGRGTFKAFLASIHPDDVQQVQHRIQQCIRDGSQTRCEYRVVLPDRSTRWLATIARAFYDETGRAIRTVGVSMDITAQKQMEDQFHQAQKMESIGLLAGGVAHDFNNLLTVVTGYTQMLADRFADDERATKDLAEIRNATDRAASLTQQLLAFGRKQILAPRHIDLNVVVKGFQSMMRRLVEENVRIEFRLANELSAVYADQRQVEQVLLNLIVNARDAMPEGGTLTIETSNVTLDAAYASSHLDLQPGTYVVLSVIDTGHGMTADVKKRLFEPFFTTKERGRGTGLGMATVYGIVKQSQGHIVVDSEPGCGATFRIFLPAATAPAEIVEQRPTAQGGLNGSETILVVEDDAGLRVLNERILRRYGYTVLMASNSEEALRICKEHPGPIDAAVVDVVLPGDSGPVIGDWIRTQRPKTRIIYMSGYTNNALTRHGVLDAGTVFLQKPFSPADLARILREVLTDIV